MQNASECEVSVLRGWAKQFGCVGSEDVLQDLWSFMAPSFD